MNLKYRFPHGSQAFFDVNSSLQDSVPQRPLCNESLAKNQGKKKGTGRCILSYTSYRQRLLDIDNLAGGTKFLTDALRYCGALQGDSPDEIDLRIAQKKVSTKAQEKTIIRLYHE